MTTEECLEKPESPQKNKAVHKKESNEGCIGKAICSIVYFGVAILQMRAVYAGLEVWLPDWFPFMGLLALVVGGTPVLGAVVGVLGAVSVWQWSWMWAIALFGGPYLIIILLILGANIVDYILEKISMRKLRGKNMTTEERIEKLEKELKTVRRLACFLIGVLAVVFLARLARKPAASQATASHGQRIEAREFVVVDAQGKVRAMLAVNADGMAGLGLRNAQGKERALLGVDADCRPALMMADAQGMPRAMLAVDTDGVTRLGFTDAQGTPRAILGVDADGAPGLALVDAQGKVCAVAETETPPKMESAANRIQKLSSSYAERKDEARLLS